MEIYQSIILGFIQGVAEFLPISSSGHLQIAQTLFGLDEVPLLYDVFLHLATLLAVCLYFRKRIWSLLKCLGRLISRRERTEPEDYTDLLCGTDEAGRKTIMAIIITTIITGVIGVVTSKFVPDMPDKIICAGFIVTAVLLVTSALLEARQVLKKDETAPENTTPQGISWLQGIIVGIMQGFGTLPGISRSGSTIAGALFSKVDRKVAGDYSFLVSIPAILGAFILELKDLGDVKSTIGFLPVFLGCLTAFIVGYFSLALLMKMIRKGRLAWFAFYLLPAGILGIIYL